MLDLQVSLCSAKTCHKKRQFVDKKKRLLYDKKLCLFGDEESEKRNEIGGKENEAEGILSGYTATNKEAMITHRDDVFI